jgi:hypothetical protein
LKQTSSTIRDKISCESHRFTVLQVGIQHTHGSQTKEIGNVHLSHGDVLKVKQSLPTSTTLQNSNNASNSGTKQTEAKTTTPLNHATQGDNELSYKFFAYHGLGDSSVEVPVGEFIEYANSLLAVHWLKVTRTRVCGSYITAENDSDEKRLPYRNHYGPLTDDPHDKWGYKFLDPKDGLVKSLWLERLGPRVDFLIEMTFKSLVKVSEVPQELLENHFAGHEGSEAKAREEQVGSWDDGY